MENSKGPPWTFGLAHVWILLCWYGPGSQGPFGRGWCCHWSWWTGGTRWTQTRPCRTLMWIDISCLKTFFHVRKYRQKKLQQSSQGWMFQTTVNGTDTEFWEIFLKASYLPKMDDTHLYNVLVRAFDVWSDPYCDENVVVQLPQLRDGLHPVEAAQVCSVITHYMLYFFTIANRSSPRHYLSYNKMSQVKLCKTFKILPQFTWIYSF